MACSFAQQWLALSALLALVLATWLAVIGALQLMVPSITPAPLVQQALGASRLLYPAMAACEGCVWTFLLLALARTPGPGLDRRAWRVAGTLACAGMMAASAVPVLHWALGVIWAVAPGQSAWVPLVLDHAFKGAATPVLVVLLEQPFLFASLAAGAWVATHRQTQPGVRRTTRAAAGTVLTLAVLWGASWYTPHFLGTTAAPGVLQAWWSTWAVVGARTLALGAGCLMMAVQLRAEAQRMAPAPATASSSQTKQTRRPRDLRALAAAPVCMVLLGAAVWSLPISGPNPVALRDLSGLGLVWRWYATTALVGAWTVPFVFSADRRWWKALLLGGVGAAASTLLSLTWNY
ncbi:MAG: hypothetical protein U0636_11995 [Phycisphaerales bacterium]